jgi:hypothetical protein
VSSRVEYIVLYISTAQRGRQAPLTQQAIAAGPPIFTAHVHGQEHVWVFRVPKGIEIPSLPAVDDELEIDDLIEQD